MQYWWNDTDRGTPKYSEKYCPIATLLKAELTWTVLGSHPRLELLPVTFSDTVLCCPVHTNHWRLHKERLAMAQAFSDRPRTAQSQVISCEICGGQSGTGKICFQYVCISL
jgi:hypothetical protein